MSRIIRRIGLAVGLPLVFSVWVAAQQNVGNITGTVKDASGAVVPGAAVELKQPATGRIHQDQTSSTGQFTFGKLDVGEYSLKITVSGFKTIEQSNIRVVSGETVALDFEVQVGAGSETLNITAEAPVVDTTSSTVGTTRTLEEIGRLPITLAGNSSRSAAGFARTVAGVNFNPAESGGQDFMVISRSQINGSMAGTWGYQIDGLEAGMGEAESGSDFISPIPEAIEEFRVTANTEPASGFNGGVSMNMTMKSGTNQIHGSVFDYMRNAALNARPFFDRTGKPSFENQNEGGFAIGGPVWIPKVYDGRNRTFFFTTLDIYRFRQATAGQIGTVATERMRRGDFGELLGGQVGTDALGRPILQGAIYDPRTTRSDGRGGFIRDPFPGNIIPTNRFSTVSQFFQRGYALPNRPGTQNNWIGSPFPTNVDKDQWTFKVDHNLNEKHRVSFSYEATVPWFLPQQSGDSGHSFIAGRSGFLAPEIGNGFIDDRDSYRYRFNYTWTVSHDLLFNLRAGVTRNPNRNLARYPFSGASATASRDAGLKGTLNPSGPNVSIQGINGFGPPFVQIGVHSQKTPVNLDLSWIKGSHNFKLGADYIGLPFETINNGNGNGNFSFQDRETGLPGFAQTGAGVASFLLGEVNSATVTSIVDTRAYTSAWGFFFQDTWRMNPKLTLTYGLRWNNFTPMTERHDKISTFDPNLPNPGAGGRRGALSVYGTGSGRNGLRSVSDRYNKAFAPHLGFAYALDAKTVIRGSYGLSYAPAWQKYYGSTGPTTPTAGFSAVRQSMSLDNGVTPAFNWDNGFPLRFPNFPIIDPTLQNGATLGFVDRSENRPPTSQNIGFEVARELPGQMAIRVGYVGNFSHRLPSTGGGADLNALDPRFLSLGSLLNANINSAEAIAAGIAKPYPTFDASVAQALRPYPHYLNIPVLGAQIGASTYHALQTNFQKRLGQGLTFLVAYTISKQLTNVDFPGFTGFGTTVTQHPSLRSTAKTLLAKDRPHILNMSWAYELPFGKGKRYLSGVSGGVNQLVGGWRVSAIQNYMSGEPIRVASRQTIPGGFGAIWPLRVPNVPMVTTGCSDYNPADPARSLYLNINAFATPAPFTFGNISRLPNVRNCNFMDETLQIDKSFPIREQVGIQFGTMMMNVFNRHVFGGLGTDINNPAAFGRFTSTSPPRNIQFYLKVTF